MRLLPRPRTVLAWALWAATTIGLVLTLRRPANPIGWLYAASALTWSLIIPLDPWLDQLVRDQRPLSLLAQLVAVAELTVWAPAIALGVTLPALLVPDGRLRSPRWRVVAATAVAGPAMFVGRLPDPGGRPRTRRSRSTTPWASRATRTSLWLRPYLR